MQVILTGKILTPIITKRTSFKVSGCFAQINQPKRRYITKNHKNQAIYPYSFQGYIGEIQLSYHTSSILKAKRKLEELVQIDFFGRFWREGMGKVQWLHGRIRHSTSHPPRTKRRLSKNVGIRIRRGLPHNLDNETQKLIRYALLHDFVNTSTHRSKIYVEPDIEEKEYLRKHHEKTNDPFIVLFQKYDRWAATITRKVRSPRTNRYTWEAKDQINFERLALDISEVANKGIWQLYRYIYDSEELGQLNESLHHGHSSLKLHLLILANLIVRDFLRQTLR